MSGCLPLLLGSARTLQPGEFSVSVAGMDRSGRLSSTEYDRSGPGIGIVEIRGGLPGDRLDAGVTFQIPWNASWDLKYQVVRESRFVPAVAAQAWLGILSQPTFGGTVLTGKSFGPVEITASGGCARSSERIWPANDGYWSNEREHSMKALLSWGAAVEYRLSPAVSLATSVVAWQAVREYLVVEDELRPFDLELGPGFFVSAGVRLKWKWARRERPAGILTALRGYVLNELSDNEIEVGRPGVYRAKVLLDSGTKITADGAPAKREDLTEGRAVLIQGLSLPQPSTFLARTIELQN